MQRSKTEPFQWSKRTGIVPFWLLRDYARWLFPQLGRQWQAEGVMDFTQQSQDKKSIKPYQFPKASGPVMFRHFTGFAEYVFQALGKFAAKEPYKWQKRAGPLK